MKIILACLFCMVGLVFANDDCLKPTDVLKQDGVLRITDGASYYEFNTNGTFRSYPIGIWSARGFIGTYTVATCPQPSDCRFTVKAKKGVMMLGADPKSDDWKIVFYVSCGVRRPPIRGGFEPTFECYYHIDELINLMKPNAGLAAADADQKRTALWQALRTDWPKANGEMDILTYCENNRLDQVFLVCRDKTLLYEMRKHRFCSYNLTEPLGTITRITFEQKEEEDKSWKLWVNGELVETLPAY